jgi:adenine-specific DNA-methyltransferase
MPTLDWIGKQAVLNHHNEVPFHLLHCDEELSVGDPGCGNLVVEGDNLLALKALLPYYAGQVKCIYIDPPYNTGNENWVYNDAVRSPAIREWLGSVVGGEAEDLSRHDKWLCMMYPRLRLLRLFLREDGLIFVSIDDAEVAHLLALMADVLGKRNHVGTVVWQHSVQPKGYTGNLSVHHNYLLVFRNGDAGALRDLPRLEKHNKHYSNPDNDPRGPWRSGDVRNALYRPNLIYDLKTPSGKVISSPPKGWRWSRQTMAQKIAAGEVVFSEDEARIIRKIYLSDQRGRPPESIWFGEDVGTTRSANRELKRVFDGPSPFDTPKPVELLTRILTLASDKDSLVLDSFAGSGTTGHAVLDMNRQDGGSRRFILVEMDRDICRTVAAERLRRVSEGYVYHTSQGAPRRVAGLGSGFRYAELGAPLFDEGGRIREGVAYGELAAHVYFSETGEPIPGQKDGRTPLLGVHNGTAIYLLYNGVLADKSADGGNALTRRVLDRLPAHGGPKVIYGTSCRLGPKRLGEAQILFRQIPYQIRVR